jgi:hypothetical protein
MILIASNNPKLVNRWSRSVRKKYPFYTVSQKTALIRAMSSLKPPVLILDVGLPRLRAARELPDIQKLSPLTKILEPLRQPEKGSVCSKPEPRAIVAWRLVRFAPQSYEGRLQSGALSFKTLLPETRRSRFAPSYSLFCRFFWA